MVIRAKPRPTRAFLTAELIVALAVLSIAMLPLSYSFLHERHLIRGDYYRALAMEIVDGEMEILMAGPPESIEAGSRDYKVHSEAAQNLPAGQFILTRKENSVRLEWRPAAKGKGGVFFREVRLP